jgi:inner membrane protein
VIFILVLFLVIPTLMINSLVYEPKNRQQVASNEVSSKWAFTQTITGSIVSIPYFEMYRDTSGKVYKYRKHLHILPDELTINGSLFPEKRYRSIF